MMIEARAHLAGTVILLWAFLSAGCYREPVQDPRLVQLGLPPRHALNSVWEGPFEWQDCVINGEAFGEMFVRTWAGLIEGSNGLDQLAGAILLGWAPALLVATALTAAGPVVSQGIYTLITASLVASTHTIRTILIDMPQACFHRLRTRRGQIQFDIRQLIRYWNGPGKRANPMFAIRGSGDMILAHVRRLERSTGQILGVSPYRWINFYEEAIGTWMWERPQ